jgi:L-rhamnose mutarotase
MQRYAFKMHLNPGNAAEYKRRHDQIWPELSCLLSESGIRNYSIFLDEETNTLFAVLERTSEHRMAELPKHAIMRRWWDYMKDLMRTHPDGEPVAVALTEVFHMD